MNPPARLLYLLTVKLTAVARVPAEAAHWPGPIPKYLPAEAPAYERGLHSQPQSQHPEPGIVQRYSSLPC